MGFAVFPFGKEGFDFARIFLFGLGGLVFLSEDDSCCRAGEQDKEKAFSHG
jgi:hypothetical protein